MAHAQDAIKDDELAASAESETSSQATHGEVSPV
jgi:hypothetical protein